MSDMPRKNAKIKSGVVVKAGKALKTITVEIMRTVKHKKYHKYMKRRTRFLVHDEQQKAALGDIVKISEFRPVSKNKRWRLLEILEKQKVDFEPVPGAVEQEAALEGGSK